MRSLFFHVTWLSLLAVPIYGDIEQCRTKCGAGECLSSLDALKYCTTNCSAYPEILVTCKTANPTAESGKKSLPTISDKIGQASAHSGTEQSEKSNAAALKIGTSLKARAAGLVQRKARLNEAQDAFERDHIKVDDFLTKLGYSLDSEGIPTIVGIANWLSHKGLVPESIYKQGEPLDTKKLNIFSPTTSGSSQEKIFIIQVNLSNITSATVGTLNTASKPSGMKTVFVLKFVKPDRFYENLDLALAESGELSKINVKNPHFPIISYTEEISSYEDVDGSEHFIQLIHAAQGNSLNDIWEGFLKSTYTRAQLEEAFKAAGQAFGALHAQFLRGNPNDPKTLTTLVHGDAHFENIFYNFAKKRITLIDNSTFHRESAQDDIRGFILVPLLFWGHILSEETVHDLVIYGYKPFFDEYLKQFADDKTREAIRLQIVESVNTYLNHLEKDVAPYFKIPEIERQYFDQVGASLTAQATPEQQQRVEKSVLDNVALIRKSLPIFNK